MRRMLGTMGGVALALTASQFPEFAQQYEQRLGGAVDQLAAIIADFDATAERSGLDRREALAVYEATGEAFLAERAGDMRATFARHERLSAHLALLESAGPLEKATGFARYYDPEIGSRAIRAYEPAVPVTAEGFVWAGAGLVVGYALIVGTAVGAGRVVRSRRSAGRRQGI